MLWLLLTPRTGAAAVLAAQQLGILEQGDFQHKWVPMVGQGGLGTAEQVLLCLFPGSPRE